jgi:hypothetical protein
VSKVDVMELQRVLGYTVLVTIATTWDGSEDRQHGQHPLCPSLPISKHVPGRFRITVPMALRQCLSAYRAISRLRIVKRLEKDRDGARGLAQPSMLFSWVICTHGSIPTFYTAHGRTAAAADSTRSMDELQVPQITEAAIVPTDHCFL